MHLFTFFNIIMIDVLLYFMVMALAFSVVAVGVEVVKVVTEVAELTSHELKLAAIFGLINNPVAIRLPSPQAEESKPTPNTSLAARISMHR
jgi:hypothetical protein